MENSDQPANESNVSAQLIERIKNMSLKQQTQLLKELDKGKDREFRKHYRKDFFMTVEYTVEDQYFQDCIQGMSNSGVFIKTFQLFPSPNTTPK